MIATKAPVGTAKRWDPYCKKCLLLFKILGYSSCLQCRFLASVACLVFRRWARAQQARDRMLLYASYAQIKDKSKYNIGDKHPFQRRSKLLPEKRKRDWCFGRIPTDTESLAWVEFSFRFKWIFFITISTPNGRVFSF